MTLPDIPTHIKGKVSDKNWNDVFIFEQMPCMHKADAVEFEKIDCDKCNFDKRETWLEDTLTKQDVNEKQGIKTLSKIIVIRGRFDDCIGIQKEFS